MATREDVLAQIAELERQAAEFAIDEAAKRERDPIRRRMLTEQIYRDLTAPMLDARVKLGRTDWPSLLVRLDSGTIEFIPVGPPNNPA